LWPRTRRIARSIRSTGKGVIDFLITGHNNREAAR
jgi:hypothetical protein